MHIIRIVFLALFSVAFFGIPVAALLFGPSKYKDVKPMQFNNSFFAPTTNDRSDQIKSWYQNREIGTSFIGVKNTIDSKLFKSLDSSGVVSGNKPNWLFLKNSLEKCKTVQQVKNSFDQIKTIEMLYQGADVKFALVIVPNKGAIYDEHIPTWGSRLKCSLKTEEIFRKQFSEPNAGVIYLYQPLSEAKNFGKVYYERDTHWTPFGYQVGIEFTMSRFFNRPYQGASIIAKDLTVSNSALVDADLARLARVKNTDHVMSLAFQPIMPEPAAAGLTDPIIIFADSFFNLHKKDVKRKLPVNIYGHYGVLKRNKSLLGLNKPLPAGKMILGELVQRNVYDAFKFQRKGNPGDSLLNNALISNMEAAKECSFSGVDTLPVTAKFKKPAQTKKNRAKYNNFNGSFVEVVIPDSVSKQSVCLRFLRESADDQGLTGTLHFADDGGGFRQAFSVDVSSSTLPNKQEITLLLAADANITKVRFNPINQREPLDQISSQIGFLAR